MSFIADTAAPLILALETATRTGSVSLAEGEAILASVTGDASSSHSTDLIENIEEVLRVAGKDLSEVDLFAAASGPGSFTGLRIGLATVKSLAASLNRKCAGVSTLAAIAAAAGESGRTVSLLPAGRGEVFAQMFSVRDDRVDALDAPAHLSPTRLLDRYKVFSQITWAGEGAHAQLSSLHGCALQFGIGFEANGAGSGEGWKLAAAQEKLAESVARLALFDWRAGEIVPAEALRANYVRPSDAEIKSNATGIGRNG